MRKVVRGEETSFSYKLKVQPMPKLGPWVDLPPEPRPALSFLDSCLFFGYIRDSQRVESQLSLDR